MNWFNTNALHNYLNIALVVVTGMAAFQWDAILSPAMAATIAGALATVKLVMNALRDGLSGLVKVQPPVVDKPISEVLDPK